MEKDKNQAVNTLEGQLIWTVLQFYKLLKVFQLWKKISASL